MTIKRRAIESREQWLEWRQQDVTASDVAPASAFRLFFL
jgi:hypothetical protein